MPPPRERSRSPNGSCQPVASEVDVNSAHALRLAAEPPKQSKFRVAALLRFERPDGSVGTIEAVNVEPHDGNIRGAICAERAALCRFQLEETAKGSCVRRVVCATDAEAPIFPGPLCREFLTSTCDADTEIIAAGAGGETLVRKLEELLPLPSPYRRGDQDTMKALGEKLSLVVQPPAEEGPLAAAYRAAVSMARRQTAQAVVFPVLFAAAVSFSSGRVHCTPELKGIEYGCTVDAVSLLLAEMLRVREEGKEEAVLLVQADNFGLAHAPFAGARSLLLEHGFGSVQLYGHTDEGSWRGPIAAKDALPFSNFMDLFA